MAAPRRAPSPDVSAQPPPETLTRGQVAKRFGVKTTAVRHIEGRLLHPKRDERGVWQFDPTEVEHVARTRYGKAKRQAPTRGALAARAFALFEGGRELHQIVIELEQPPDVIRDLYDEYTVSLYEGREARRKEKAKRDLERREDRELEQVRKLYDREAKAWEKEQARLRRLQERVAARGAQAAARAVGEGGSNGEGGGEGNDGGGWLPL